MRDIQKVLAALNSPVRREILGLIWDRELSAGEIAAAFPVTKPTISQHLAVLREAGLAESTAVGTSRRYRARPDALRGLRAALGSAAKWINADDAPERASSDVRTKPVVVASTDVDTSQAVTFAAFTDPVVYSRWLGVPVTLSGRAFRLHDGVGDERARPVRAGLPAGADRDALGFRRRQHPGPRAAR